MTIFRIAKMVCICKESLENSNWGEESGVDCEKKQGRLQQQKQIAKRAKKERKKFVDLPSLSLQGMTLPLEP